MYTFQGYQIVWFINDQQIHEWPSAKNKQTNKSGMVREKMSHCLMKQAVVLIKTHSLGKQILLYLEIQLQKYIWHACIYKNYCSWKKCFTFPAYLLTRMGIRTTTALILWGVAQLHRNASLKFHTLKFYSKPQKPKPKLK
jgi:hypothetical protein